MRHIFSKIFGGYLIVIILLSSLILFFSFRLIRPHYLENLGGSLGNLNETLEISVLPLLQQGRRGELDSLIKNAGRNINTRITVIAPDGKVIADSKKDAETLENHANRPEIEEAAINGQGQSLRYSETMETEMLYRAAKIEGPGGENLGYLRSSLFLSDINMLIGELKGQIQNLAIIVVVLTLFAILIFSRTLTNPIKQLASAAREVAGGNFNTKVYLKNKDELKELADSFNYMTSQIRVLFNQISLQKEELDAIINSIQEGFLVLDTKGKLLMANQGAVEILGLSDYEGKQFEEALKPKKLKKIIKKTLKKEKNISGEIKIKGRSFLCSSNYLSVKEEIVLILYDISEMRRLEQIKKDFVVNVSHELRTPLTAIKGFIETMDDEFGESEETLKYKKYSGIILRHTERLINIVQDLLLLSNLEDTRDNIELSEVNLKGLIYNVLRIFEQKFYDKGLKMVCSVSDEIPAFQADAFKLEQLFVNLIDNAIKYTDEGGISIQARRRGGFAEIEISDTGIGMPQKGIERIFERFYTVDKSRSRKLGGTGLGLSIVKHITLLHSGEINVTSEPGNGACFKIKLPLTLSNGESG